MEIEFNKDYLTKVVSLQAPSSVSIEDYQICYDYAQLRNNARFLLRDSNNERARKNLSRLVLKLQVGII